MSTTEGLGREEITMKTWIHEENAPYSISFMLIKALWCLKSNYQQNLVYNITPIIFVQLIINVCIMLHQLQKCETGVYFFHLTACVLIRSFESSDVCWSCRAKADQLQFLEWTLGNGSKTEPRSESQCQIQTFTGGKHVCNTLPATSNFPAHYNKAVTNFFASQLLQLY